MPSMNTTGLYPLIEAEPRIRISPAVPGAPDPGRIVTPGVFDCNTSVTLRTACFSVSSLTSSCVMELPTVLRSAAPAVPVTTSCSSCVADCVNARSSCAVAPAFTVTVRSSALNPSRRARTVRAPAATLTIVYSPFWFVSAPEPVPTTVTCTSLTGRREPASVTRPRIVPTFWALIAWMGTAPANRPTNAASVARTSRRNMWYPPAVRARPGFRACGWRRAAGGWVGGWNSGMAPDAAPRRQRDLCTDFDKPAGRYPIASMGPLARVATAVSLPARARLLSSRQRRAPPKVNAVPPRLTSSGGTAAALVVANPHARRVRRGEWRKATERQLGRRYGVEIVCPASPDETTAVARRRMDAEQGPDVAVGAGGDGTVRLVASELAGTGVPLGVLPLGTGNDFARANGIPPDVAGALDRIIKRSTRAIDLLEVNGRRFVTAGGIGIGAHSALIVPWIKALHPVARFAAVSLGPGVYRIAAGAIALFLPGLAA